MIERHRRRLANGEERVYTYGVGADGERQSLSIRSVDDSLSISCYRRAEKERVVAALLANASLLVVGEAGAGKTFLAERIIEDLWGRGFPVAAPAIGTVKQMLLEIAGDLGVDTETLEGKPMTAQQLQETIAEWLYQFSKYQLQIEHPGYNLVQQLKQLPLCSFLRVVDQLTNVIPLSL